MTAQNFDRALAFVLSEEGGWSDHPKDPGGATNLGITLAVAQENHLDLDHDGDVDRADLKKLTPDKAAPIYKAKYWRAADCDQMPSGVDLILFDAAVNHGPRRARDFLQCAVAVKRDGIIGQDTMDAVLSRTPAAVICAIELLRKNHYWASPNFPVFGKGWLARLDRVTRKALEWA